MYGHERKDYTLSRPAIDEKSKGFAGNPAPGGMKGIAGAGCASEELDPDEVFFTAGLIFSSASEKHVLKANIFNSTNMSMSLINKPKKKIKEPTYILDIYTNSRM
ncbi:hypothetical protein Hanom_Chr10g00922581 [Helianthus anomalus]